ncbi:hypothetical protein N7414_20055 [Pseudomonas sp. GD04087]|uniref:hypothetical protein n=1 Tax=unclassified Pseudomonas TaxID=196821 RepID=UPI00244BD4F6|nr:MULTISPECIES: hypothetical protein [unclassified Pseudomonas]MDH0291425.1 hypothetical protein [Pseudomonas sp. GD04087]MDH1051737.1 hypothetical protein [Pseudomonas sp. GD03903]MDH2001729.1 hypothetical protein [Pseudomonas sp. GD03691]
MNSAHWFWHWLLGIAAIAFFGMLMAAIEQRDEARRLAKPVIDMNGTTIVVSCPKPATPTAASPAPRQERFIL